MAITTPTSNIPGPPKVGNLSTYSLQDTSVPKGEDTYTDFSSKKKLTSSETTGERRAPAYALEQMITKGNK